MFLRLKNAYDSHVHWLYSGQKESWLNLSSLTDPHQVQTLPLKPDYFAGEWLVGFGWDHHRWPGQELPHRSVLDKCFGGKPVVLSRADGHAVWVSTRALELSGFMTPQSDPPGGRILRDPYGSPTGVLIDSAAEQIRSLIPQPPPAPLLKKGMQYFNARGFTHIRDLSCDRAQWDEVVKLEERGELTLAVEQFFDAANPDRAEEVLKLIEEAKTERLKQVRVKGLKIFYDGSLGSESALLSCPYCSGSGSGLQLLNQERLRSILIQAWEKQIEVAVHAIGDEANHQIAACALDLWQSGYKGILHLEHAQMMRPETIALLKGQSVICHLQPCHWLSDRHWLKDRIPKHLLAHLFPWRALEQSGISFDFGSDSPIEEASIQANLEALEQSAPQIPQLKEPGWAYHQHPDSTWVPECYTDLKSGIPHQTVFAGRALDH